MGVVFPSLPKLWSQDGSEAAGQLWGCGSENGTEALWGSPFPTKYSELMAALLLGVCEVCHRVEPATPVGTILFFLPLGWYSSTRGSGQPVNCPTVLLLVCMSTVCLAASKTLDPITSAYCPAIETWGVGEGSSRPLVPRFLGGRGGFFRE